MAVRMCMFGKKSVRNEKADKNEKNVLARKRRITSKERSVITKSRAIKMIETVEIIVVSLIAFPELSLEWNKSPE